MSIVVPRNYTGPALTLGMTPRARDVIFEAAHTKEQNKLFSEAKEEHHVVDMVMPEVGDFEGVESRCSRPRGN